MIFTSDQTSSLNRLFGAFVKRDYVRFVFEDKIILKMQCPKLTLRGNRFIKTLLYEACLNTPCCDTRGGVDFSFLSDQCIQDTMTSHHHDISHFKAWEHCHGANFKTDLLNCFLLIFPMTCALRTFCHRVSSKLFWAQFESYCWHKGHLFHPQLHWQIVLHTNGLKSAKPLGYAKTWVHNPWTSSQYYLSEIPTFWFS